MGSTDGTVLVWDDVESRGAAMQMAIDEALLDNASGCAVLRHYRWAGNCASFGAFQSLATARAEAPDCGLVRRWTAGGVVRHDRDWTFSLILPSGSVRSGDRPSAVYCWIHRAVAVLLERHGMNCRLAGRADQLAGASCFQAPADGDVLGLGGEKVCGGAQRRTRRGVLHQGSLQGVQVGQSFLTELAAELFDDVQLWEPAGELLNAAARLAATKYSTGDWLERVP